MSEHVAKQSRSNGRSDGETPRSVVPRRVVQRSDRLEHERLVSSIGLFGERPTRIRRRTDFGSPGSQLDPTVESRIRSGDGGRPLDPDVRQRMESGFGADLRAVRIHTESDLPAAIDARAFAAGDHIHFAPGEFAPHTDAGAHDLAHEIAHTLQADASVHRLVTFDADNQKPWKDNKHVTLTAFIEGTVRDVKLSETNPPVVTTEGANKDLTPGDFVRSNLKQGDSQSPVDVEIQLGPPSIHTAVGTKVKAHHKRMLELRDGLLLASAKPAVDGIRRSLQQEWRSIIDLLTAEVEVVASELEQVARLVAADFKAGTKLLVADKKAIIAKHRGTCIADDKAIQARAQEIIEEMKADARQASQPWAIAAKRLSPEMRVQFDDERQMIERRLKTWEMLSARHPTTNEDGTYGTSFGGTKTQYRTTKLHKPVYDALLLWWKSRPGDTYDRHSDTAARSLAKKRDGGTGQGLSPIFSYHVDLAR